MHHFQDTARLDPTGDGAGGVARISAPYPPPVPPAPAFDPDAEVAALLERPPAVTRYERGGRRHPRATAPFSARLWAATSALLVAVGVSAVVFADQDAPASARVPGVPVVAAVPMNTLPIDPGAMTGGSPGVALRAGPAGGPVRVRIPALGMSSRVMHLGLEEDGSMEVPPGAFPVGWYDRSPVPGQLGSAVLAGHVDWAGERGAFYGLRELRAGDVVVVDRADGSMATFAVERVQAFLKADFPTQLVYGDVDHAGLRLITCGGAFDEDTGDYQANVVAFARLVSIG